MLHTVAFILGVSLIVIGASMMAFGGIMYAVHLIKCEITQEENVP